MSRKNVALVFTHRIEWPLGDGCWLIPPGTDLRYRVNMISRIRIGHRVGGRLRQATQAPEAVEVGAPGVEVLSVKVGMFLAGEVLKCAVLETSLQNLASATRLRQA
jgi:hypothetical protein